MAWKYVVESGALTVAGRRIRVTRGEAWDERDPIVLAYPDAFADEPTVRGGSVAPVERATATPGEKRLTRRA